MTQPTSGDLRPFAVYKRMLRYAVPHWLIFVAACVGMVMFALVTTSFSLLTKPLVDGSFVQKDPATIRWIPLAIIGLFVVRGIAYFLSSYGMAWVGRRVTTDLRHELFDHLLMLPVRFYDRNSSGLLITRLTYHVEQVAEAITAVIPTILRESMTFIGALGVMFYLNWKLSLFCLVVGPLIALVVRYVGRRFRKISERIQESVGYVTQAAEEAVTAQRVIKIHGGQDFERATFKRINERTRWLSLKVVATQAGSVAIIQFIAAWAVAAIVYFATQPAMLAEITPGTFTAFIAAMLSLMNPMKSMGGINEKLQRGITAATDIFKLMSEPPEPAGGTRPLKRAQGRIEFDRVGFRYRTKSHDVLRDISLSVEPGQTVAFVGRSGSGKSTLLSLLPRFYDVSSGVIRLDGHDIRDYPLQQLREQIALVDQQVRLFNATIAENIAYGLDPVPDEDKIIEAAKSAYAWEFIEKLPKGIHTEVGQNGVLLSGGQRQRIAIARALLRNAPILILDEATSALDTESERYIQQALERLVEGRTTLVIAHRLSTIQGADHIVVMQEGRIVESGQHAKLLARNGMYAALHRMQFEDI